MRRSTTAWAATLAAVAIAVAATIPPTPKRLVQREGGARRDHEVERLIAVGTQGRWRLKKVRVSSRKRPLNGSEGEPEQRLRYEVGLGGVELAALVDQLDHRLRQRTRITAAAGSSGRTIWRIPLAIVERRSPKARRAAKRDSVGKITVVRATENIPLGKHVDAERLVNRRPGARSGPTSRQGC